MQLTKSDYEPLIDAVDILYKHRDELNAEEKRFLFRAMNSVDSIYMKKEVENEKAIKKYAEKYEKLLELLCS